MDPKDKAINHKAHNPLNEQLTTYDGASGANGTGIKMHPDLNSRWEEATRPIIEAYFHARYFLEMAVKYGKKFKGEPPNFMPSGWAALLYLYELW